MRRTLSRLPLALTIGLLATGCSPDTPTPTTPTLSADRGREIEDRDDDDDHAPVTYAVIGDNDWTDCHRANNGGYNSPERLGKIRSLCFSKPG